MSGTDTVLSFRFSYGNKIGIENIKRLDISNTKDSCRKIMFLQLKMRCSVWQATVMNV